MHLTLGVALFVLTADTLCFFLQLFEEIPNIGQETSDQVVPQGNQGQASSQAGKGKGKRMDQAQVVVTHHQLPRDPDPMLGAPGLAAQELAPPPGLPPLLQGSQVTSTMEDRPWVPAQVS